MKFAFAVLALVCAAPVAAETPAEVAARYNVAGEVLVAKGDKVLLDQGFGTIAPGGTAPHRAGESWRLASITKQIVAAAIIQSIDADKLAKTLDFPIGQVGSFKLPGLTVRQLLTHHSGLANPDDTPHGIGDVPAFYLRAKPDMAYCLMAKSLPGGPFKYNNCDYIVAGMGLMNDVGEIADPLGMHFARAGENGVPGFVGGKPEPHLELGSWGAAGGLIGTAPSVFAFDRALMTGKLLTPDKLAVLWTLEGNGSYQALGQWVFPGRLKGCAAPTRIVQRDGEIEGVQTRNFILPDADRVVIVFTNRSADDFPLGEVWEGKGFVYDLLSAAACGEAA